MRLTAPSLHLLILIIAYAIFSAPFFRHKKTSLFSEAVLTVLYTATEIEGRILCEIARNKRRPISQPMLCCIAIRAPKTAALLYLPNSREYLRQVSRPLED
jgi:hypothetical protein